MALAAAEPGTVEPEAAVVGAELAGGVGSAVAAQALREAVPVQDPDGVLGEEAGPGPAV